MLRSSHASFVSNHVTEHPLDTSVEGPRVKFQFVSLAASVANSQPVLVTVEDILVQKSQGIKVQSHFKDRFFYHNQSLKLAELLRKLFFLSNFWLITRFVTCLNLDESYEQVSKHLSTYSRAMLWLICTVEPADCINLQRITIINGQQKHWTLYIYMIN